jgi:hypothetical protein
MGDKGNACPPAACKPQVVSFFSADVQKCVFRRDPISVPTAFDQRSEVKSGSMGNTLPG